MLGSITGGVLLYSSGQKKMKKIATQYNMLNSTTSYYQLTKRKRDVSLLLAPNGFRITF